MPIIKSAMKRAKQQLKRRSHNLQVKRLVHDDTRALHDAVATGDAAAVTTALRAAQSEIDRAVKKGVLHKNTASRRKSQLSRLADTVLAQSTPAKPAAKAAPKKAAAAKKAPATKKPAAKKAPAKKPAAK